MEKQFITEDMHLEKEWFEQARKIHTIEELASFANKLLNEYEHDYGTVCHAIAAISVAGAWLGAHVEGITGFQAGFVMWDFVREWNHSGNKCGMRLIDYDDMLYPQHGYRFEKTISSSTWKRLQEEAKQLLDEGRGVETVRAHWQSIVDGKVLFGYIVKED